MHGLVSLLPPPYYQQVEALWQELAQEHNLHGIHVTPYPHFSWQIAREYNFNLLEKIVAEFAATTQPFRVFTAGLGLFTGARPVIFIPVVKDAKLMELHQRIWERVQPASTSLSPFYAPTAWMPHISLAYEDLDQANIAAVMPKLAFRSFNWEMIIDNIALIYEPEGEIGALKFQHAFEQPLD